MQQVTAQQMPGMIDWLTLIIDASLLDPEVRKICYDNADKLVKISREGEVLFEVVQRQSIRSDSHHVTVHFGSTLQICGSPARVRNCNNVFGSIDIQQCAIDMIRFVVAHYAIFLPINLELWRCSKIDVTLNYDLGSLEAVKNAIDHFKPLKVGRQKTATEDTTVMWGKGSCLHMGKIYAKGPHSRLMFQKSEASFTPEELRKADRLLRVEYSIRRLMIRRLREGGREWYQFDAQFLLFLHSDYFSKFLSQVEVVDMDTVRDLLVNNVGKGENQIPTIGQAEAAYDCYTRCKMNGFQYAKSSFPKGSFSRHLKNLRTIGLDVADLQALNVVPLRRRPIVLDQPVLSWDDIKLQA